MMDDGSTNPVYDHVCFWLAKSPERKGTLCRVLVRAGLTNSILVGFESDGYTVITSRSAVLTGIIIHFGPALNVASIKREMFLATHFVVKRVKNARCFEDRTGAGFYVKDV